MGAKSPAELQNIEYGIEEGDVAMILGASIMNEYLPQFEINKSAVDSEFAQEILYGACIPTHNLVECLAKGFGVSPCDGTLFLRRGVWNCS